MSCPYYRNNFRLAPSKALTGTTNPTRPITKGREWCEHERSPRKKGTIGNLECNGDPAKCPIPENERQDL